MLRQLSLQACLLACAAAGVTACFSPIIQEGRACSESDRCPGDQVCTAGTCRFTGQNNVGPDATLGSDGRGNDGGGLCAGSQTFNPVVPAVIQNFSVPACATSVTIEAFGAQGGGTQSDSSAGGRGARMKGDFALSGGGDLRILVGESGQAGSPADGFEQGGGTGGGGSFVVDATNTPMVIAAGGGGATEGPEVQRGGPGQIGLEGQSGGGHDDSGGLDNSKGLEGGLTFASTANGFHGGTGGGSFVSPGENDSDGLGKYGTPNTPGDSFMNGGAGGVGGSLGRDGGFGGGGASGFTGGGGGGYTGGGGGGLGVDSNLIGGGGGGSINNGTSPDNSPDANAGPGKITIDWR